PTVSGSAGSISASGDISGNNVTASANLSGNKASVGPVSFPPQGTGSVLAFGGSAEIGFGRRNLTTWPSNPVAGDRYVWYSSDGSRASLWTEAAGDLLSVTKDGNLSVSGSQNLIDVFVQLMAVQNADANDNPGKWTCSHANRFSKIYARFVVFQGFTVFGGNNSTAFNNIGHSV